MLSPRDADETTGSNLTIMGNHFYTRWLLLRLIAAVYFVAFVSFLTQARGLIGSHGILPACSYLNLIAQNLPAPERYFRLPSLAWISCSDAMIQAIPAIGTLASLAALSGLLTLPALLLCWICYLSIVSIGQDFMSFQWDILLLECGFLGIFLAPAQAVECPWKSAGKQPPPVPLMIWLFRLLLFRLMFMSGCCKLLSNDPTWSSLQALNYHYETQPLPTPLGYIAGHLPEIVQKFSVLATFFIELIVPFFIFGPRKLRLFAGFLIIFLQLLIALTGNYTYFNLLTAVICLSLFDDGALVRITPAFIKNCLDELRITAYRSGRKAITIALAIILIPLGVTQCSGIRLLPFSSILLHYLNPFCIVNGYGLFAVMTTKRYEIRVEGSNDGKSWLEYEFPFKPSDLHRSPPIVAPFQPRLDWQLWFAALGPPENSPWFTNFVFRLLQGSPDVLSLLSKNPFPSEPPKFVRAQRSEYHFTPILDLLRTGSWWQRQEAGMFLPPVSLENFQSTHNESEH